MDETIQIRHPKYDTPVTVSKADYIRLKTNDLREFGYNDLKEETVAEQLEKVLSGEKLSVIGRFIEGDIVLPE